MNKKIYPLLLLIFGIAALPGSSAQGSGRYLVLNFDCHGEAFGKSGIIGDSLRYCLKKSGADIVSRDLTLKLLASRKLDESDLNYVLKDLKSLLDDLNADAAVYGHVLSSYDLMTVELRVIDKGQSQPVLFDPIVCGRLPDLYATLPRMAELILSPDRSAPKVLSIKPSNGEKEVEQYVDMIVTFSKPMNPATFSLAGYPENMWVRYGDVIYDEKTYTFIFKVHFYPGIEYEFHINGADSKGFKDEYGNVAPEYIWRFATGRW